MVFVTVDRDRSRLERLTKLLVESFPGSTIYQHVDPQRAPTDVLYNRVDGVFLEEETRGDGTIDLMVMLHRQKPRLPVFILTQTAVMGEEALAAGAAGYLCRPFGGQELREIILSVTGRENLRHQIEERHR